MTVEKLIEAIEAGKARVSEEIFESLIQDRIEEALETRRVEITMSMFNTKDENVSS